MKARTATLIENRGQLQIVFDQQNPKDAFNLDQLSKHAQQRLKELLYEQNKQQVAEAKAASDKIRREAQIKIVPESKGELIKGNEFQFPQVSNTYFEQALKSPNPSIVRKGFEMALCEVIAVASLKKEIQKLLFLTNKLKALKGMLRSGGGSRRRSRKSQSYPPQIKPENIEETTERKLHGDIDNTTLLIQQSIERLDVEITALKAVVAQHDQQWVELRMAVAEEVISTMGDKEGNVRGRDGEILYRLTEENQEIIKQAFKKVPPPNRARAHELRLASARYQALPESEKEKYRDTYGGNTIPNAMDLPPIPDNFLEAASTATQKAAGDVFEHIRLLGAAASAETQIRSPDSDGEPTIQGMFNAITHLTKEVIDHYLENRDLLETTQESNISALKAAETLKETLLRQVSPKPDQERKPDQPGLQ